MSLCSSYVKGSGRLTEHTFKRCQSTDAKLVPVVELTQGKKDLKHLLITEIAIKDRELSLNLKKLSLQIILGN